MSRKRWGNLGYLALVLGVALFSLLVGINALGLWDKAAGLGTIALWAIIAAVVVTLHLRSQRGRGAPTPTS